MKKLSEIYKELGIAFSFPIEIKDSNGDATYYEASNGYCRKYEYDTDGNETYFVIYYRNEKQNYSKAKWSMACS